MAGSQVFTSADLASGLCLSEVSGPLSCSPHKQSRQPGLMLPTGSNCWFMLSHHPEGASRCIRQRDRRSTETDSCSNV